MVVYPAAVFITSGSCIMSVLTRNFVILIPAIYLNVASWLIQKSLTGLSIRNKGESALSDSINSHQLVQSLSASQQQIKFDMFCMFTCAQKDFPGTFNLHHWKSSKEWASFIPDYQSMSKIKHKEFSNSIEELYSVIAFQNWMEAQQLWLGFIFNDMACHGACACLFSRSEYQKDSGNFPHEHTILALKKDNLNS